jgi:hypothetical protein
LNDEETRTRDKWRSDHLHYFWTGRLWRPIHFRACFPSVSKNLHLDIHMTEKEKLDDLWYDAESSAKGLAWLFLMGIGCLSLATIIIVYAIFKS